MAGANDRFNAGRFVQRNENSALTNTSEVQDRAPVDSRVFDRSFWEKQAKEYRENFRHSEIPEYGTGHRS